MNLQPPYCFNSFQALIPLITTRFITILVLSVLFQDEVDRRVHGHPKFPIHRLENSPTIAATTGWGQVVLGWVSLGRCTLGGHLTFQILTLLRYVVDIGLDSSNPKFF